MRKYLLVFLAILLLPLTINASEYKDIVAPIANIKSSDQITIYLFYGEGCPHCAKEKEFLNELKAEYKDKMNIVNMKFGIILKMNNYLIKLNQN